MMSAEMQHGVFELKRLTLNQNIQDPLTLYYWWGCFDSEQKPCHNEKAGTNMTPTQQE